MSIDPALSLPLAWFLAGLLVLAAAHKLSDKAGFAAALEGYALVPRAIIPLLAVALAAVEAATAVALVVPALMVTGAMLAAALFSAYGLVMVAAILRGRGGIDCGCHFGKQPDPLGWPTVARNAALVGVGILVALPASRTASWADIVSGALAGGALLLILHSVRTVRVNRAWVRTLKGAS